MAGLRDAALYWRTDIWTPRSHYPDLARSDKEKMWGGYNLLLVDFIAIDSKSGVESVANEIEQM